MKSYDDYEKESLVSGGFDPEQLTERQRYLILQPIEAPEDFYQDGEITAKEAELYWQRNLHQSGLSVSDIGKAIKLNL